MTCITFVALTPYYTAHRFIDKCRNQISYLASPSPPVAVAPRPGQAPISTKEMSTASTTEAKVLPLEVAERPLAKGLSSPHESNLTIDTL